jgi:hypothetical protein
VADHPKRPAKHHWLGQPLPDQLPNTTQALQTALLSFLQDLARTVRQIPTPYAPVRHFVLNALPAQQATALLESLSANALNPFSRWARLLKRYALLNSSTKTTFDLHVLSI